VTRREGEHTFSSTTWGYRRVKISTPAGGTHTVRRSRSFKSLRRQDRAEKVTLRISYRGGAESWWLVESRGTHAAFPGWLALEDLMRVVKNLP
jgi:hypothetical protein